MYTCTPDKKDLLQKVNVANEVSEESLALQVTKEMGKKDNVHIEDCVSIEGYVIWNTVYLLRTA